MRGALVLPLWLSLAAPLWADPVAVPPQPWTTSVAAVAEPDLGGAEPYARDEIRAARQAVIEALAGSDVTALGQAYGRLGALYHVHGIDTAAEACYRNARRLDAEALRWHYYAALLALDGGRPGEALERLQTAVRIDPDYPPLALRLGRAWYELNRFEEARGHLRAAAGRAGLRAAALYDLGQIALAEKDYSAAIGYFDEVLALDPAAARVHYPLAQALRYSGESERARVHLAMHGPRLPRVEDRLEAELLALDAGPRAWFQRGVVAARRAEYAAAARHFSAGLAQQPDNPAARVSLARALFLAGDYDAAREQLEEVLVHVPTDVTAHFFVAVWLQAAGRVDAAVAHYRAVLAQQPDHDGAHFLLGGVAFQGGDFAAAEEHFERAAAGDPDNVPARLHALAAAAAAGAGEEVLADRLARWCTELPSEPTLRYARVRLLAAGGAAVRDGAQALALARQLVREWHAAPALEALALAQAANGDFEAALATQQELVLALGWSAAGPLGERLLAAAAAYEEGRVPVPAWPPGDAVMAPVPPDAEALFREYPVVTPF